MVSPEITGRKFLRYEDLVARGFRWSRVHLRRLERAGKFPLHVDIGANSIAWVEVEILEHEARLIAARDAKGERKAAAHKAEASA